MKMALFGGTLLLIATPVWAQVDGGACEPASGARDVPPSFIVVQSVPPSAYGIGAHGRSDQERPRHRRLSGPRVVVPPPAGYAGVVADPGPTSGIGSIVTSGIGTMSASGVGSISQSGVGTITRPGIGEIGTFAPAVMLPPVVVSPRLRPHTPAPAPVGQRNAVAPPIYVAPPLPVAPPLFFSNCR